MTQSFMAAFVLSCSAGAASAFMAGNPIAGGELAAEHCAACHADGGEGRDLAVIAADEAYTLRRIKDSIAKPHWTDRSVRLSRSDVDNLLAFILSLRHE